MRPLLFLLVLLLSPTARADGVIVVDPGTSVFSYGHAVNLPPEEAERQARAQCHRHADCKVVARFRNECAALYIDPYEKFPFASTAPTEWQADGAAQSGCRRGSVLSGCTRILRVCDVSSPSSQVAADKTTTPRVQGLDSTQQLATATSSTAVASTPPVLAEKRVALVIGNGKYVNASALHNPPNDARAVARALNDIGFEVTLGQDLDRSGMERLLRDFLRKAASANVALLFYAGHGMQVEGRNYLIPVDAKLEAVSDLNFGTVELDKIVASLDDPSRAAIIILDACRDNPLARSFASRLTGTRSGAVGSGLAGYSTLGSGTLIAFATAPGQVALDGNGTNSPFTQGLVKHLRTPGLEVRQMLTRVRADVATATKEKQVPWDNSSLRGDVYLAGHQTSRQP